MASANTLRTACLAFVACKTKRICTKGGAKTLPSLISLRRFGKGKQPSGEKGEIMKTLLCALLMAFSTCFADICETTSSIGILRMICGLNKSVDSLKNVSNKAVTNEISIKVRESDGIDIFLKISLVFTIAISITVSGSSIFFTSSSRKSMKNTQQGFENWFESQKDSFKNQKDRFGDIIDNKKNEMDILKREFESWFERQRDKIIYDRRYYGRENIMYEIERLDDFETRLEELEEKLNKKND